MLLYMSSHDDFLGFLHFEKRSLGKDQIRRLQDPSFKRALLKVKLVNTDLVQDLIFPLYSPFGRPANDPSLYIRSIILMQHFGYTSIDKWCTAVANDSLLQYLIGSWNVPGVACHYDFINRITQDDPHLDELYAKGLFNKEPLKKLKKEQKLKKNDKLINFTPQTTVDLYELYKDGLPDFEKERKFFILQQFMKQIAVIPSMDMGFIDSANLVISGDGTCLHIHVSPYGHKAKGVEENAALTHRYGNKNADFGWDSDLEKFFFGHTLHNTSVHNESKGIDLPIFITLEKASQHDALTSITSIARLLDLHPEIRPKYVCFDSASDSTAIYQYLRYKNIIPIIDLNKRRKADPYSGFESLNENGFPVCRNGTPMIRNGYDYSRMRTKFRCPLACGKIDSCPYREECGSSGYGRVVYVNDADDLRLFGPVQRGSDKWKKIYNNRTCTERINTRILNDYHLQHMMIRNDSKQMFFAIFACINIHLDAWAKDELKS